jgi:hypothetical protein
MSTKTKQYANQCLAGSGFAIMNSNFAWMLRPDLFASAQDCGVGFNRNIAVEGTQRFIATFSDGQKAIVISRSPEALERRIEWVAGLKVVGLASDTPPVIAIKQPANDEYQRLADERKAELKDLAGQELPPHECALRKDILAARRELGILVA